MNRFQIPTSMRAGDTVEWVRSLSSRGDCYTAYVQRGAGQVCIYGRGEGVSLDNAIAAACSDIERQLGAHAVNPAPADPRCASGCQMALAQRQAEDGTA